ncbi:hypothetical protein RRG08_011230 [Elysia crispata]|uniref:Uncharacterized protein n=1 Tax=Elysia crispata TaxID=231223 RepID=A0AAE1D2E4_9GAST|nr:hypothetical protein RRG08_011230 [Elysia crispata]
MGMWNQLRPNCLYDIKVYPSRYRDSMLHGAQHRLKLCYEGYRVEVSGIAVKRGRQRLNFGHYKMRDSCNVTSE